MIKLPETMTEAEFLKVCDAANKKHHKLAFALGFYQGMRVNEIVRLLPEHIDYGQKLIRIKQGKGSKDRNIPIAPQVMKGLKLLPIGCGDRALEIAFKNAVKKSGINRDLHFHNLRHSSATYYLSVRKWDSAQVQRFLGHSSLQTTQIYLKISPSDLTKLMWE